MKINKCKTCGGTLAVDPGGNIGTCNSCGNVYDIIGENLSIHKLTESTINNLLLRSKEFLDQKDFNKALDYIEKAKDIDVNNINLDLLEKTIKEEPKNIFQPKKRSKLSKLKKNLEKKN